MEHLQLPATISKLGTLVDGTIRATVDFQEISPEEEAKLFQLRKQLGWFLFKPNPIVVEEVPMDSVKTDDHDLSLTQRLVKIQYKYYMELKGTQVGFNEWRTKYYENQIQQFQDKIYNL